MHLPAINPVLILATLTVAIGKCPGWKIDHKIDHKEVEYQETWVADQETESWKWKEGRPLNNDSWPP